MRFVIFGAGAIGGVVGARLHQSGYDVHLIARGSHHDAIAANGLTLETPTERVTLRIPVSPGPAQAAITDDDIVLLAVKSQDTISALRALREAAPSAMPPIVCLQNGVANERAALRLFPDVHGTAVMSPTAHLEPGVVTAFGGRVTGALDTGRYPHGTNDVDRTVTEALAGSRYESIPRENIMVFKYAKLVTNLGNAIQAVCGTGAEGAAELRDAVSAEGRSVLHAAGIQHDTGEPPDGHSSYERWGVGEVAGQPRGGGSTWQSVTRAASGIETDYLNGEIVLLAREHGVAAPLNELLQELAHETLRRGERPGWIAPREVLAAARARAATPPTEAATRPTRPPREEAA